MQSSTRAHKRWLRRQLTYADITHDQLLAMVILLERVVQQEQSALLRRGVDPPFYGLTKGDGTGSVAWQYVAETTLWLDYKNYSPWEWFTAACRWPPIRRRLMFGQQIPLNWFCPTSRLDTGRLRQLEQFYLRWRQHRG